MTYYESMGRFTLEIPDQAIPACSHSGACDDDVAYWLPKIDFSAVNRESLIDSLSDTGGWSRDEMSAEDDETLQSRVLWIACCDLKEDSESEVR